MAKDSKVAAIEKMAHHPDRDLIIKMFDDDVPLPKIITDINSKYTLKSEFKHHISLSVLKKFQEHVNEHKAQIAYDQQNKQLAKVNKSYTKKLESDYEITKNNSYKTLINSIAEQELNIKQKLLEMFRLVENRLEALYNNLTDNPNYINPGIEQTFLGYIDRAMNMLEKNRKILEGESPKQEINVNINIINDQLFIMRDVLMQTMARLPLEDRLFYTNELTRRMKEAHYELPTERPALLEGNKENIIEAVRE